MLCNSWPAGGGASGAGLLLAASASLAVLAISDPLLQDAVCRQTYGIFDLTCAHSRNVIEAMASLSAAKKFQGSQLFATI